MSSQSDAPAKPKPFVHCAMGIYCLNMRKPYYEWMRRTQLRESGASTSSAVDEPPPRKPTRGTAVPVGSALQNHFGCFLPCGHFCCNWVPVIGIDAGAIEPGQTCASLHSVRCNGRGNVNFDALWTAAAHHKMLGATRPCGLRRATSEYVTYPVGQVSIGASTLTSLHVKCASD